MNLKELLLKGQNFIALLNQLRIDAKDLIIRDEEMIFNEKQKSGSDVITKSVFMEGKNGEGSINLFGRLHFNLLNKLAVFEMEGYEKVVS
ncbi:hypothetical protein [Pedobacter sp. MW01-1-1]|uniref:hypothetical protein n=1 Tax=Pedobacter sp. MW01-1-1 TaxID=3383027 RepID=UPI003FEFA17F